jgi:predicted RNase H-like HicB family nuclease
LSVWNGAYERENSRPVRREQRLAFRSARVARQPHGFPKSGVLVQNLYSGPRRERSVARIGAYASQTDRRKMEQQTVTYTIIMEQAPAGDWNALVPDLPGLLLVGKTREELLAAAPGAILDYLEVLVEDGEEIPRPTSEAARVTVPLPAA